MQLLMFWRQRRNNCSPRKGTVNMENKKFCGNKPNRYCNGLKTDAALFYLAFFLMVFAKAFGLWQVDRSYYVMFCVSALLLAIRVLMMKKDSRTILTMGLVLIPSVAVFFISHETTLLFTCLFVAASKDIDFETCIKYACIIYIIAVPLRVLLYFLGLVEGGSKAIYAHDSSGTPYLVGHTYGYGYVTPNMLFAAVFITVLLLFYVKRHNLNLGTLLATSIVILIAYVVTKCKTGLVVYLAVVAAIALMKIYPKKDSWLIVYCLLLVGGSFLLGAVLPFFFSVDNPILFFINEYLISGRLLLANNALLASGVGLLGGGGIFVDILYMDVLLNCGITGFIMLLLGGAIMLRGFIKEKNMMGLICAAAMILYACMEQFPLNIAMNPFLLYIGCSVYKKC